MTLLTALGPTFIKAGQSASIRTDLLPPAYIKGLTALQDQVPPFPTEEARQIIKEELGRDASAYFKELTDTPVAAASLGQVYRGQLQNGTEAAIKAQPGYLSKSTVICCSQAGDGPRTFDEIFGDSATMKSFIDTKVIVPGKHGAATVVYSAVVSGVVAMVFQGTKSLLNMMLRMVARVVAATKATGGFF